MAKNKILSLIAVAAFLITSFAFAIPAAAAGDVTITYEADATAMLVNDTVNVAIKVTNGGNTPLNIQAFSLHVAFDYNKFALTTVSWHAGLGEEAEYEDTFESAPEEIIPLTYLANVSEGITVAAGSGTETIATLTFTATAATDDTAVTFGYDNDWLDSLMILNGDIAGDDFDEVTFTANDITASDPVNVYVIADIKAYVENYEINADGNDTFFANPTTVIAKPEGLDYKYSLDGSNYDTSDQNVFTTNGAKTLYIKVGETFVKTVNFNLEIYDGDVAIQFTGDLLRSVNPDADVTANIELAWSNAASIFTGTSMVAFTVKYDPAFIELDGTPTPATLAGEWDVDTNTPGTITVAYDAGAIASSDNNIKTNLSSLLSIPFKVLATSTTGSSFITIEGVSVSKHITTPVPANYKVGDTAETTLTVAVTDAPVSPTITWAPREWTANTNMPVHVVGFYNIDELKYVTETGLTDDSVTTIDETNVLDWFKTGPNGTSFLGTPANAKNFTADLPVEEDENYWVYAAYDNTDDAGNTLAAVKRISADDIKLDVTGPTGTITGNSTWKQGPHTFLATDFNTVTDAKVAAISNTAYYKLGSYENFETSGSDAAVVSCNISAGVEVSISSNETKEYVTFAISDTLGNVSYITADLKLDKKAPVFETVTLDPAAGTNAQVVGVTFIVTDEAGAFTTNDTFNYKYSAVQSDWATIGGDGTTKNFTNSNTGDFNAEANGYYYVRVTDEAGNYADREIEVTNVIEGSAVPKLQAKTAANGSIVYADLLKVGEYTDFVTNGTFKNIWLKLDPTDVEELEDGYAAKIQTSTDGGSFTDYTAETKISPVAAATDYTVKVVVTTNGGSTEVASETYKFSIIAEGGTLPSVNNDNKFNLVDYAKARLANIGSKTLEEKITYFEGGVFADDVTGDLVGSADDFAIFLRIIRRNIKDAGLAAVMPIYEDVTP